MPEADTPSLADEESQIGIVCPKTLTIEYP